jgi:hypothetical protein
MSRRLIDVEDLSEQELRTLERYYTELAKLARQEADISHSHSVEEARSLHSSKVAGRHARTRKS